MNRRLQQFLAAENISQAQFAETINVARATVSHILSGRNNPGYEFIQSVTSHYPNLSLDWLINGVGKMYKNQHAASPAPQDELFAPVEDEIPASQSPSEQNSASYTSTEDITKIPQTTNNQRKITRITVFYDDGTYQEIQ